MSERKNEDGLETSDAVYLPTVRGKFRGLEVELIHDVQYGYKSAQSFSFIARARIPTGDPSQTPEQPGPVLEGVTVVSGWIEYAQSRRLDAKELEPLLEALVRTARSRAVV
jgi:hypothetical protein